MPVTENPLPGRGATAREGGGAAVQDLREFASQSACRCEAVILRLGLLASSDRTGGLRELAELVEEASDLGLHVVIRGDWTPVALDRHLGAHPNGPGELILVSDSTGAVVEVESDTLRSLPMSVTWGRQAGMSSWLWAHGIASAQTVEAADLVFDDDLGLSQSRHAPLLAVLRDQISRRARGELPDPPATPGWTLRVSGRDPTMEGVTESLLTLADGRLGTRGRAIDAEPADDPPTLMSGIYNDDGPETHLLPSPIWDALDLEVPADARLQRVLDLRNGLLHQRLLTSDGELRTAQFSSRVRPATTVLRAYDTTASMLGGGSAIRAPAGVTCETGGIDDCSWMRVIGSPGSVVAASHQSLRARPRGRTLQRITSVDGSNDAPVDAHGVVRRVRRARNAGAEQLLNEHRRAWSAAWEDGDVTVDGDPELQLAVRFCMFHLLGCATAGGEAAIGARGLTGSAYRGHVFWDTDVYVLPFLAAVQPEAARAVLEYRVRRLPAALEAARAVDREGARFPWESAGSGDDVTPDHGRTPEGELVPILTGRYEEHIVADVAWAAATYIDWSGDFAFAAGPGRQLLLQTARWWASRIEIDEHGAGHIRRVIGPDEYHERVDDNAFTNVMARWNLRCAAADPGLDPAERSRWLTLAGQLVDGHDGQTGVYEQFRGFSALEPLRIADIAPHRPVAADLLLGRERVQQAQVLKQADVLMLHYLIPDEVAPGSLGPNLDFYEPRTAHGSTLSPGVHAALLARAGRTAAAAEMLALTARIDLDDIGHTTAGGLHLAAMGSMWRALSFGFLGCRPVGEALAVDPVLPSSWQALTMRLRFHGARVEINAVPGEVGVQADRPLQLLTGSGERISLSAADRPSIYHGRWSTEAT